MPEFYKSESQKGNPIQAAVCLLLMIGGGWYFVKNYRVGGLDGITISQKEQSELKLDYDFAAYEPGDPFVSRTSLDQLTLTPGDIVTRQYADLVSTDAGPPPDLKVDGNASTPPAPPTQSLRRYKNIKIASWALDGFGPSKLASDVARRNLVRVIRKFDIIALQQITSIERDLVSRLVDSVNEGGRRYDYVIGRPTGPPDRPEQLVFLFDVTRVHVDRSQTYTLADPENKISFDPLVAWFQAAEPISARAWTFSLVNVRVDLSKAAEEVQLLPGMIKAVRADGRREDDVLVAGLFQADDAYLLPSVASKTSVAAVRSTPTDIFNQHQTSNLLYDSDPTTEAIGRSGAFDFLRVYNLDMAEAEACSSHLPVFAEFSAIEGGQQ